MAAAVSLTLYQHMRIRLQKENTVLNTALTKLPLTTSFTASMPRIRLASSPVVN